MKPLRSSKVYVKNGRFWNIKKPNNTNVERLKEEFEKLGVSSNASSSNAPSNALGGNVFLPGVSRRNEKNKYIVAKF